MADTHVAPRSDAADDGAARGGTDEALEALEAQYDLPWRMDLPALRTLRVVRRVVPPTKAPRLDPADPRVVLHRRTTAPRTLRARVGIGPSFRISTRSRIGVAAVLSAGLGLAGSYGNAGASMPPLVNSLPAAHVLGAEHWQAAAPRAGVWAADPTGPGLRAGSCTAQPLPAADSAHRVSAARAGSGVQHVSRATSPGAGAALVDAWLAGIRTCARQAYGRNADVRTLGTYGGVENGLTIVGVFYALRSPGPLGTTRGADLFAVGRDGRLVTTLELRVPGAPGRIPVGPFTAVAKRALAELR